MRHGGKSGGRRRARRVCRSVCRPRRLSLSSSAFEELGRAKAVVLLYDAAARIVGLRKAGDHDLGAYRVRADRTVTVKAFTRHYGISFASAMRFPWHDYGGGVHGFSLGQGIPVGRGGHVLAGQACAMHPSG
jgi:hypothetical protein